MHCYYHTFWELKLFINVFDILFKCVNKYLRNIIIVKFFYKSNWLLRIECIVKTLYVVTKSAKDVFLILNGVALFRVWLACWRLWRKGFKIRVYNKWDLHWSIVIFKRYFSSFFGKFNLYSCVWFTILMVDANDFSELKVLRHRKNTCLTCPCFDVCKITVYLYLWSNSNVVLYHLKLIKIKSALTFIVVFAILRG